MLHWVSVLIPPSLVTALATYLWIPVVSVEDSLPPSTGPAYHRDARGWSTNVLLLRGANEVPPPPKGRGLITCCFREVSAGGPPPDNATAANVAPVTDPLS